MNLHDATKPDDLDDIRKYATTRWPEYKDVRHSPDSTGRIQLLTLNGWVDWARQHLIEESMTRWRLTNP